MRHKLIPLIEKLAVVSDLYSISALLNWDQQTYMPPGGAEGRGNQRSTIETIAHQLLTSAEIGDLLHELEPYESQFEPDSYEARLIKVTLREYRKQTKVPSELIGEIAQVSAVAHQVWEEARAENNFNKFQPHLQKVVELRRRYAEHFAPYEHIYDPLLDDYEPGLKTTEVKEIFDKLRPQQIALVQSIAEKPLVEAGFLSRHFDEQKQWDFGVHVITCFGYDWQHGRQDRSAHPFTQSIGLDDVRITTRINPKSLIPGLFGTMHEAGHALYDQGIDHKLGRSPLGSGVSLAIHESQSRLWENLIGRSHAFWEYFYPNLQSVFPSQLGNIPLEKFYRGINRVQPSPIRVEADEATYNMHIMLRLELEIDLIEKKLEVRDLPEAWNTRMKEYLGIVPENASQGILQDVHWSSGLFGYFPTYTLGNLISAQLWECINADIPDLSAQIRKGVFSNLLDWLREKIHRHGAMFEPQELIQKVTGSKINPEPYIRYLKTKYNYIYNL